MSHHPSSELYHENGQLSERSTNRAGVRHGPYERYEPDGQLRVKGTYNMGEGCGEWIYWDGATIVDLLPRSRSPCPPDLEDGN
jgi:antitoxin component YwqK of YwqJK toxin-antitoxin module